MSKNTDLGSLVNYIKGQVTGRLNAPAYTSATAFTGTIAGYLGFDTSGNILTSAGVGFTGSGTTNYIPKFTGSTSLGNSNIQDSGSVLTFGVAATFSSSVTARNFIINEASVGRGGLYPYNLVLGSGTDYSVGIFSISEIYLATGNSATKQVIISSTGAATFLGTVGIGNAISAWGAGTFPKVLQVGNASLVTNGTAFAQLTNNMYYDGSAYRYITSNGASRIVFESDGVITFNNATSGTAGNTVSTSEKMRIDSSGRFGLGTTSTSGYAMTVTGVDGTDYSPSSLYKITTKFVNNTSENKGIGIGYHTNAYVNTACIYSLSQGSAAYPQSGIAFGVYNYSTSAYVIRFLITETTVKITNIPTDVSGLGTGDLYRDGSGYVKIAY